MYKILLTILLIVPLSSLADENIQNDVTSSSHWNGLYLGGGLSSINQKNNGNSFGINGYGHQYLGNNSLDLDVSHDFNKSKSTVNVQLGYNWSKNNFIYGLVLDVGNLGASSGACHAFDSDLFFSYGTPTSSCQVAGSWGITTFSNETKWISTQRVKLGYSFDSFMVYASGGTAIGNIKSTLNTNCPGGCGNDTNPVNTTNNWSDVNIGYTVGLGAEMFLYKNWTLNAEYLYIDLGNVKHSNVPVVTDYPGHYSNGFDSNMTYNALKLNVNYRF